MVVARELAKAAPYLFDVVIFHHFSIFDFQRLYSSNFPKKKAKGIKADTTGSELSVWIWISLHQRK